MFDFEIDEILYVEEITIIINNNKYIINLEHLKYLFETTIDKNGIRNKTLRKWNIDDNKLVYYNNKNNKKIYLVDLIVEKKISHSIKFVDNNNTNYKQDNLKLDINLPKEYKLLKDYPGVINTSIGKYKNKEFNKVYYVEHIQNKEKFHIMEVSGNYTIIDYDKLEKIRKINDCVVIWYMTKIGYACTKYKKGHTYKHLYLHQHLMNHYGNGTKNKVDTVDHINRNKLDNRLKNLRIATFEEQQLNKKGTLDGTKRERKHNAQDLPKGIRQDMLPKYVVYYKECYDKDKKKYREFFKIEKHPKLDKDICTTKSTKISIEDKLEEAKEILKKINETGKFEKIQKKTPIGISYKIERGKPHFILDYRNKKEKKRYTLRMVINVNNEYNKELKRFIEKVKDKYNDFEIRYS